MVPRLSSVAVLILAALMVCADVGAENAPWLTFNANVTSQDLALLKLPGAGNYYLVQSACGSADGVFQASAFYAQAKTGYRAEDMGVVQGDEADNTKVERTFNVITYGGKFTSLRIDRPGPPSLAGQPSTPRTEAHPLSDAARLKYFQDAEPHAFSFSCPSSGPAVPFERAFRTEVSPLTPALFNACIAGHCPTTIDGWSVKVANKSVTLKKSFASAEEAQRVFGAFEALYAAVPINRYLRFNSGSSSRGELWGKSLEHGNLSFLVGADHAVPQVTWYLEAK